MKWEVDRVEGVKLEDGEVEGETKTDGVGRGEISLGDIGGVLIIGVSWNNSPFLRISINV